MKKLIFVLVAVLGMSSTTFAQTNEKEMKKAVKAAQRIVKDAKDEMERADIPDKRHAKQLIDQAMQNDLLQNWDQMWLEAAIVYREFYNQENVKSYNGRYDTVTMYNYLTDWFKYTLKADSLEQIPNSKGKTSKEAREDLIPDVYKNMGGLINGGIFYFNHREDYAKAYELFDTYFTMAKHDAIKDLAEADEYFQNSKVNLSYFPGLAAFYQDKWADALKYFQIAKDDEEYGEMATVYLCECYGGLRDSAQWLQSLKDGLVKYPTKDYFYSQLLNYYNLKNDMGELEKFVQSMIEIDPEKAYNYYVLGYIAQQSKDYAKAIEQYQVAIDKDETLADAYNNLGLCIMSQATEFMDSKSKLNYRSAEYKKALAEEKEYYKKALPYYEKLKTLEPDAVAKWGLGLYTIYYKLDMEKEMNQVEKQLKSKGLI